MRREEECEFWEVGIGAISRMREVSSLYYTKTEQNKTST